MRTPASIFDFIFFLVVVVLIFVVVPNIRSSEEYKKNAIFSTRVRSIIYSKNKFINSFGFRSGGGFLRLTLYEDFLISTLFTSPIQISYKEITDIFIKKFLLSYKLIIRTNNCNIKITSSHKKLEKILSIINKQRAKISLIDEHNQEKT